MVRVIRRGRYRVYVFPESGERHHRPHCHIYWPDGSAVVALDDLRVLEGDRLSTEARALLQEFEQALWQAWSALNTEGSES